jgi:hypothetical protein
MKSPLTKAFVARCSAPLGLMIVLSSCRAERYLVFNSEPSGAQVQLDGKMIGVTPLEVRFESYGHRHIRMQRRGYRSFSTIMEVETPWYSYFPLDYISEILLPFGWEDIHTLNVTLKPRSGEVSRPDFEGVLERAESLRRGGPAGPTQRPATPAKDGEATEPSDSKKDTGS